MRISDWSSDVCSSEPPRPRVSEQSVIVNEDAIAGLSPAAPVAGLSGGRRYLASTIYFGHGSANLTGAERREIADIARAAAANGAGDIGRAWCRGRGGEDVQNSVVHE